MDIWQILMTPFSWLLKVFCQLFDSYAIALVLFTIIIKIILFPFNLKGKKGQIKMTMANGQLQEIQKRCGNDKERYQREVQKFYADNNISPFGGCGWMLIPIVILYPLYAIIRRPLKYMMGLTETATVAVAQALGWTDFTVTTNELTLASMINSENLAAATAAAGTGSLFVINFNFLGIDLSKVPQLKFWETDVSWGAIGLFLLPIISAVLSLLSMIVSQRTNQVNKNMPKNNSSLTMMLMGPIVSLWIGYTLPAGMCLYWITNSVLMIVQEIICGKLLKKDYEAAQKELEEQNRKAKEEEKERRRQAAERKAAAIAANNGKSKKTQPQNKNKGVDLSASREGIRAYARGRAYDPNRYPVTPYHDPNGETKPVEEPEQLTEEEKALLAEVGAVYSEEKPAVKEETAAVEEESSAGSDAEPQSEDYEEAYAEPSEDEEPNA